MSNTKIDQALLAPRKPGKKRGRPFGRMQAKAKQTFQWPVSFKVQKVDSNESSCCDSASLFLEGQSASNASRSPMIQEPAFVGIRSKGRVYCVPGKQSLFSLPIHPRLECETADHMVSQLLQF